MDNKRKAGQYKRIIEQMIPLLNNTHNPISRMSTINAILFYKLKYFFWVGFYLLEEDELIVGPYQGPLACQILTKNTGVCWTVINQGKTIIVPDIKDFPGHISCDSRSKSEISVPLKDNHGKVIGVLDVDSNMVNQFNEIDTKYLEEIAGMVFKFTKANNI